MPDTTPPANDPAASVTAQPALEAVQVALDRRDNGGHAATTGHHRINRTAAGNDHLGRRAPKS